MSLRFWFAALAITAGANTVIMTANAADYTVNETTIANYVQLQGVVESTNSATVSAQVSGRVEKVLVDVGDTVAAGATIVTITSVEQYQMLTQAQAQLAAANASLVAEQQEFDRISSLVERQLVSVAERDRAKARLDNAKAQLRSAQAAVERAEEQLSYTEVKAPYGGVVSVRMVEPGELVQPGTPLMSGFDPSQLRLHVDIPASYARAVKQFNWARVNGVEPTSLQVFPTVHSQSGTVRIRLVLPQQSNFIPGQWQPVKIKVGEHPGVLVPYQAIHRQGELTLVRMQNNSWRAVRLGASSNGMTEVVSGLQDGEVIIHE
ncbi:efflux RND transporter periplasmic adaptor subunit [Pseudidiomarina woesei]|uniref:RND family efflux transporter, MFP subunit n=1 Tax=Pseudidiomarina woesei TaxID=1381080 RepID=A0A0K6H4P3_9GAMM|nr:efflux RND transporter periplasmic adaptor subunit [Pseudidiomarina woesei]CUA85954.1 RND family efflux transporter, MFP subunit [Pseudidiomarina woesei]